MGVTTDHDPRAGTGEGVAPAVALDVATGAADGAWLGEAGVVGAALGAAAVHPERTSAARLRRLLPARGPTDPTASSSRGARQSSDVLTASVA
jgi:hypothetical protein